MPDGVDFAASAVCAADQARAMAAWRQRYLAAVRRYLVTRQSDDRDAAREAVMAVACMMQRYRRTGKLAPCDGEQALMDAFRRRLWKLVLQHREEWSVFLTSDVGIDDEATRKEFLPLSPFKGCYLILSRSGEGRIVRGDVKAARAEMRRDGSPGLDVIYRRILRSQGRRKNSYVLMVFRPKSLSPAIS